MPEDKPSPAKKTQVLAELTRSSGGDFYIPGSERAVHPRLLSLDLICSEHGPGEVRREIIDDLYHKNSHGNTLSGREIPDEANYFYIGKETIVNVHRDGAGITVHYFPIGYCKVAE